MFFNAMNLETLNSGCLTCRMSGTRCGGYVDLPQGSAISWPKGGFRLCIPHPI
jgi:hypothetical protein